MVSRSVNFESLGVEVGKEHPLLWDSLREKCRLGYSREQEVLEHIEGTGDIPGVSGPWSRRCWSTKGGLGTSLGCLVHQQSY